MQVNELQLRFTFAKFKWKPFHLAQRDLSIETRYKHKVKNGFACNVAHIIIYFFSFAPPLS